MPHKRILLLYISEISGHHSATLAIEKAIRELSADTEILNINAFHYTNPISEKIVNRIYMSVIKATPQIWDYLYDNPIVAKRVEKIRDTVHKINSTKLKNLFDEFRPDAVACTQAFPCGMVADFKKTYNSAVPLVAVLTDYVPHSYWIYDTINYYIAPSEDAAAHLIKKGVAPEKIKSSGIPFDHIFNQPVDKGKITKRLGLDPDAKTILIMGGGQGLGPIKTVVKSLEKVKKQTQNIIVCGSNKKLYGSLKRKVKKYKKKTLVFGYVQDVHELMGIADIIITKPGGITTVEALSKKLPMIIVKPIPGQETSNTIYLSQKKAALEVGEPEEINLVIDDLLEDERKLAELRIAASRLSKPNASMDIAQLLLDLSNA